MDKDNLPSTKDFYCDFVLSNKLAVEKVRETERVLAYYHTKPNWTMHIVIIPKQHITRLVELEDMSVIQEIFEVAQCSNSYHRTIARSWSSHPWQPAGQALA